MFPPDAMDRIVDVKLSRVRLPLSIPVSDAKVLAGRQQPLRDIALLFAEITTERELTGIGFSYALRIGGPGQFAHAREIAPLLLGEDASDIGKIWTKLLWAGASVGRSGLAVQAMAAFDIALWDLKAKRAELPLAKLLGSRHDAVPCYNTSGGYLQAPVEEVLERAQQSLANGVRGIKIKVGHPDSAVDLKRVEYLRTHLGDEPPLMVDANQQWDRPTALRVCRRLEPFNLTWIEEPLNAYDLDGHAAIAATIDTPIATGEMLSSVFEQQALIDRRSADIIQPDAPRLGGITPFLQVAEMADRAGLDIAPHFVMEIHIHLSACSPGKPWIEHFEWLEPLFNERLEISGGCMQVPRRVGLGLSLSERMRACTEETAAFAVT